MSTDTAQERLTPRIPELYATDAEFAAARPDEADSAAIDRPAKTALITGCSSGYGL
jgi:fatty acid CoA ligase FadD9